MSAAEEITRLKALLRDRDDEIARIKSSLNLMGPGCGVGSNSETGKDNETRPHAAAAHQSHVQSLTKEETSRYSRQLIMPQVGAEGQIRLRTSSVLIVGAGGLGCPAAIYLAAAGIGHLGIVDYDQVELSNLHRQVMHREATIGTPKAFSLAQAIRSLNSTVRVSVHNVQFDNKNAMDIVSAYDVVLDCSDNPATRYLLNDAAVLSGRPLVSGSALRWEGQLTVYNYKDGPCYRCLYPSPPDPKYVTNCSDGGVIGAVPGMIGTMQAMETIKLLLGGDTAPSYSRRLLVFDGESGTFRVVNLRPRQPHCAVCSGVDSRTIHCIEQVDYAVFCGRGPNDKEEGLRLLSSEDRVTATEFRDISEKAAAASPQSLPYLLIDVRPALETTICCLPNSVNLPFHILEQRLDQLKDLVRQRLPSSSSRTLPVYVVCRRGNNSQLAVERMRSLLPRTEWPVVIQDIVGGLEAWAAQVDPDFPIY